MIDTMIRDGLWDAFNGYHMGMTAENVAKPCQITREDQDKLALAIQQKASAAQKAGQFKDEITPVTIKGRKGDTIVDRTNTSAMTPRWRRWPSSGRRSARTDGHGGQRQRHQRRRGRACGDVGSRGGKARPDAARPDRVASRPPASIPRIMGTGPDPVEPQALAAPAGGRTIST